MNGDYREFFTDAAGNHSRVITERNPDSNGLEVWVGVPGPRSSVVLTSTEDVTEYLAAHNRAVRDMAHEAGLLPKEML